MDKIEKTLREFSKKEREKIKDILKRIDGKEFKGLNLKKLKGQNNIFRVRKEKLRIIYRQTDSRIFILTIEKRTEKTYKNI